MHQSISLLARKAANHKKRYKNFSGSHVSGVGEPFVDASSVDFSSLDILVSGKKSVNRRFSGALLRIYGCCSVQIAEDDTLIMEAVEGRARGLDVAIGLSTIGSLETALQSLLALNLD